MWLPVLWMRCYCLYSPTFLASLYHSHKWPFITGATMKPAVCDYLVLGLKQWSLRSWSNFGKQTLKLIFLCLYLSPFKLQQREEEEEKDNFKAKHSINLKIKHNKLNIDLSDYCNHFCLPPSIYPSIILPSPLRRQSDTENETFFFLFSGEVKLNYLRVPYRGEKE